VRRVLDLSALAVCLGKGLVVGHLHDHVGDLPAEVIDQLRIRRLGVLDRVVQNGSDQRLQVIDPALGGQHVGQRDRVVDVRAGLGVLAPLRPVAVRGEGDRGE